ncbi:MAG: hypothetical protein RIC55_31980 [Pirellulaceae bacterium]
MDGASEMAGPVGSAPLARSASSASKETADLAAAPDNIAFSGAAPPEQETLQPLMNAEPTRMSEDSK